MTDNKQAHIDHMISQEMKRLLTTEQPKYFAVINNPLAVKMRKKTAHSENHIVKVNDHSLETKELIAIALNAKYHEAMSIAHQLPYEASDIDIDQKGQAFLKQKSSHKNELTASQSIQLHTERKEIKLGEISEYLEKMKAEYNQLYEEKLLTSAARQLISHSHHNYSDILNNVENTLGANALEEFITSANGNLITTNTSEEMKELVAAALNINQRLIVGGSLQDPYKAKDITFKEITNSPFKGKIEVVVNLTRGKEGTNSYRSLYRTMNAQLTKATLTKITAYYQEQLAVQQDLAHYLQEVNKAYKNHDHNEILQATEKIAVQYSDLSKEERMSQAQKMLKELVANEGKKQDYLYTIKENCKWILNKITFGLSKASVEQEIDAIFKKAQQAMIKKDYTLDNVERGTLTANINTIDKPYQILKKSSPILTPQPTTQEHRQTSIAERLTANNLSNVRDKFSQHHSPVSFAEREKMREDSSQNKNKARSV